MVAWVASIWTVAGQGRVRARPIAALVAAALLAAATALIIFRQAHPVLGWALAGGGLGFVMTALGAAPALFARGISARAEDTMLGFAAGIMLAASAFSLILPGIEVAQGEFSGVGGGLIVVFAFLGGAALMMGLEASVPHAHLHSDAGPRMDRSTRAWFLTLAIALHNVPEGMAVGVAAAGLDWSVAAPVAFAIAIQDAPEGLAVALALRSVGVVPGFAVLIAAATGMLEPLGAGLGVAASIAAPIFYPIGLGVAAGAMVFVVSHEVIPETHRNGHQRFATIGLLLGFALMTALDTSFA